jgi:HEAT repeats
MEKKWRILLAALLVAPLCGFGWWLLRPSEPSYKGKSLSVWLEYLASDDGNTPEAREAVRQIGANAIPTLLRMLRANDSPLKTKCIELLDRQHLVKVRITPALEKNYEAGDAFSALGVDAAVALPDLIQIYDEKISTDSQRMTAVSIGGIGPAASVAIPTLLRGLQTTNDPVRGYTVYALGEIHSEPVLVVPELANLLHDSNGDVRCFAAQALGEYGTSAESSVPDLIRMLNDPQALTRYMATNALKQIDPEADAKADVK